MALSSTWIRRILYALFAAALFLGSWWWGRRAAPPPVSLDAAAVAALLGAGERPERISGPPPYWRARVGEQWLYAAESALWAPEVKGYGGELNLLVVLDAEGNYYRIIPIRHRETPSYVDDAPSFFQSFIGRRPAETLEPGTDIDAITRATVSSRAFAAAARTTGRRLAKEALAVEPPREVRHPVVDWPWALAIAAFFGAGLFLRRGSREWVRILALAAAVGVLGFWGGRFLSLSDIGRLVILQPPPWPERISLYALLAGGFLVTLAFGNVYCGWVCPFGALTEILYKIPIPKIVAPAAFARKLGWLRVAAFGAALGVIVATRKLGAAAYEPFDDLFAFAAAGWSLAFLAAILVLSIFHYRFFCRYLCGVGGLLGELAAVGKIQNKPPCRECGDCVSICPSGAIQETRIKIDKALCLECGRCRRICPVGDTGKSIFRHGDKRNML